MQPTIFTPLKPAMCIGSLLAAILLLPTFGCNTPAPQDPQPNAAEKNSTPDESASSENTDASNQAPRSSATPGEILGNPAYQAFCYGGYRQGTRDEQPTVEQIMQDLQILHAMNVRIVRTYNSGQFEHASTLLKAIRQLKSADPEFEMYVMLGAWINCDGAWTDERNHQAGDVEGNKAEIDAAVRLANEYPDIVKVIAVGNEAMVHWATQYYVAPSIILKWVNHLQDLKANDKLPADIWITSSDNYESWGGGETVYRTADLESLIKAVDYVSLHTYPFHETHYDPEFWAVPDSEQQLSPNEQAARAVERAINHAKAQYQGTADYIKSLNIDKPVHIGETGWASISSGSYGAKGSKAADEYKLKLYYDLMRAWTNEERMSCFYFEAFDEKWKDAGDPDGSENHFGLITLDGQAKYPLWDLVDKGIFDGLARDGKPVTKTFGGDSAAMQSGVLPVPLLSDLGILKIKSVNSNRRLGNPVTESRYIIAHDELDPDNGAESNDMSYPSAEVKLNIWEGSCNIQMSKDKIVQVTVGTNPDGWWGCGLEIQPDESAGEGVIGENLSEFKTGKLHFEIQGDCARSFNLGFQSGKFVAGNQVNNFVTFGPEESFRLTDDWKSHSIPIVEIDKGAEFSSITGVLYLHGQQGGDGKSVRLRRIFYSKE